MSIAVALGVLLGWGVSAVVLGASRPGRPQAAGMVFPSVPPAPSGSVVSVPPGSIGLADGRYPIDGVLAGAVVEPYWSGRMDCVWMVLGPRGAPVMSGDGWTASIPLPDRGTFVSHRCGGWVADIDPNRSWSS